jgi:phospholipid/cholesterol/gamma-HCH transport system substrate-binding protein
MAQSKTRWAQLRVGIMAIVALVILSALIFLMSGSQGFFRAKSRLYSYLNDSAGLAEAAPVRLNGILVGKVKSLALSGESTPGRIVKVTLEVDDDFLSSIPNDSQANIAKENLLGTGFIDIKKGKSPTPVKAEDTLGSSETPELEDLFAQGASTIAALQITLKRVDDMVAGIQSGNGTIGKLLSDDALYKKVVDIVDEAQKLIVTLNDTINDKNSSIGKLLHDDELYQEVHTSVTKVNGLLEGLEKGQGSAGKLLKDDALYDDVRKTIADTRALINQINSDQSTVGKLIKSDELHKQILLSMSKIDMLIDKMNSGQGTIGQLLVNPSLYESLDGTTRELHGLLQDFRANPKKFLRIKLGLF